MHLLVGTKIQQAVASLISRHGDVDIAVAYWGRDSLERTGIKHKHNGKLRVICDLLSGACNPAPIAEMQRDGVPVRTLDRLHAKVWINGNDVILGSANASMAGLPMPDDDPNKCRDEANVEIQSDTLAQSLRTWFEERWGLAQEIADQDLRRAWKRWSQRPKSAQSKSSRITKKPGEPGISEQWRTARGLRLLAYDEGKFTQAAQQFHQQQAECLYTDEEWAATGGEYPFYEWQQGNPGWTENEGTAVLDFSRPNPNAPFQFNGLWTVRPNPSVNLDASALTLLNRTFDYNGKCFTEQELRQLVDKIQTYVDRSGGKPDPFGSLLDVDFFGLWYDEHPEIRQRLIDTATQIAIALCRSGGFSPHITLTVFQICAEDPDWTFDYAKCVGVDIFANQNDRKKELNPILGQRIREAIGGVVPKTEEGRRRTRRAHNELIGSYTIMDDFNRGLVGTDDDDE